MFHPVNDDCVVDARDALNAAKAHAIDVYFEALFSDLTAIASFNLRIFYELSATIDADMVLLATSMTVFANVVRLTFWTFHRSKVSSL